LAARGEQGLRDTASRCVNETLIVPTDVSKEDQCRDLVAKTVEKFERLDVLILNAAKSVVIPFEKCPDPFSLTQQTLNVNLMHCIYLTKYSLPHLKKTNGIIAPVSSVAGLIGSYGSSSYSASKHAIHGFFKSLRLELDPKDNIGIVLLPVPYVRTSVAQDNLHPRDPNFGMEPKECARLMSEGIANRHRMYFFTWETWFGVQLSKFLPGVVEGMTKGYLEKHFQVIEK